jgi:hypothetical protein
LLRLEMDQDRQDGVDKKVGGLLVGSSPRSVVRDAAEQMLQDPCRRRSAERMASIRSGGDEGVEGSSERPFNSSAPESSLAVDGRLDDTVDDGVCHLVAVDD